MLGYVAGVVADRRFDCVQEEPRIDGADALLLDRLKALHPAAFVAKDLGQ